MSKLVKAKSRKFWLTFVAVFIGTIIFQMAANGVFAAGTPEAEQQFSVQVRGEGKPVMLIPGLMSDGRVWDELAGLLAKSHQVFTINLAGFGATPKVNNPSLEVVKQQILSYIRQHKLDKPVVIGHSLGGFMSFWLASSAPSAIGPIISVDGLPFVGPVFTRTNATTVQSLAGQAQQFRNMYANMSQQQLIDQSAYSLSIQASSDAAKQIVMDMITTSDPNTVGQAVFSLMNHDLRQDIANITSPVLLLGASGGFSKDEQKSAMQTLYAQQLEALPTAKLQMNNQSRHFIMYDDPNWLAKQIMDFLGAQL